ncbi:MAG: D-TA family PLP-dependent enzyme [Candidatus Latescibacteria bacterium]|jgi:D-threonine aldolase|nr:D-TA family PLP-dependent enzyme [Candidatus Latescibacterota bacterium]MBT4138441.1 D-TA family PLP-dependent enzyme [Candidatus Latescibacterota bacterium]MBT5831808.1 D-TA family PLP-dependent enzyme [Candidatus Latescibacterota bacterium]
MDEYLVKNADEIPTPALLVYKEAVAHNIKTIGEMMGGYERLRPHIKTHKMAQVAKMEMAAGIDKFKCATPKEAAMLAALGAADILISYHMVGANIGRVVDLKKSYPALDLKVIADDANNIQALSDACVQADLILGVMLDLNTGMDRTGAPVGEPAVVLATQIHDAPGLTFEGLHVYDGHVGNPDADQRKETALDSIGQAIETRRLIAESGVAVPKLVASGSPGFEHTRLVDEVDEVSPGTWIFWDTGYGDQLVDSPFRWAALVLSRVISTTQDDLMTLDAGSKSIAPDTPEPHFRGLGLPDNVTFVRRNEEHQLLRLPQGTPRPNVGDTFYLVPRHVCTTVNLWDDVYVIDENGQFVETWSVDARGH